MTPVVEPHRTYGQYTGDSAGCSDVRADGRQPMPDPRYTPAFRKPVADTFGNGPAVVSGPFHEPYPDRATATATRPGSADGTAVPAPASGTRSPVYRIRSTPYGRPAPIT